METTRIGRPGFSVWMSLMSSSPFLSGSEMSSRIKSNGWLGDGIERLAGVVGLGADLQVGFVINQLRQPVRIIGWSSTMSTRFAGILVLAGMVQIIPNFSWLVTPHPDPLRNKLFFPHDPHPVSLRSTTLSRTRASGTAWRGSCGAKFSIH